MTALGPTLLLGVVAVNDLLAQAGPTRAEEQATLKRTGSV
jgi:hypothetical protein